LAADVGEKTGTLGPSLQQALRRSAAFDHTFRWMWARFFYLALLVLALTGIATFLMIKIVPVFTHIFQEFTMPLPSATRLLIATSNFVTQFGLLLFLPFVILAGGALVSVLLFVGVPAQSLPIVRYLAVPIDNATVLHALGTAVRQRQSISGTLQLLAGLTPSRRARRRLNAALQRMEGGAHWVDALERAGLATAAQGAVIKSAERAGNLAWALTEMADTAVRRAAQRARAVLSFVFPLCVIAFASCVLLIALGIMDSLFSLIRALA
jgi:type II secretory pathway component PulF